MGELEVVVEVVAAFWSAEEEGATFAVGESGAEGIGPGVGFEIRGFVEGDEIKTMAAEGVGVEAAFDIDDGTVQEMDGEFLFGRSSGPHVLGYFFETTPDDALGEFFGRGDVPDEAVGKVISGTDEFGECEFGFAEAAASDEDAEAFWAVEDLELTGVETEFSFARARVGRGWQVGHGSEG